jgi:hypothetical protein
MSDLMEPFELGPTDWIVVYGTERFRSKKAAQDACDKYMEELAYLKEVRFITDEGTDRL